MSKKIKYFQPGGFLEDEIPALKGTLAWADEVNNNPNPAPVNTPAAGVKPLEQSKLINTPAAALEQSKPTSSGLVDYSAINNFKVPQFVFPPAPALLEAVLQEEPKKTSWLEKLFGKRNTVTTPAQTTPSNSTQAPTSSSKKSWKWNINFDKDGDYSWDNLSVELLKDMYSNGYDFDLVLDNGYITDNSLQALYQTVLGQSGDKIRFNQDALQAAKEKGLINDALLARLIKLLPQVTSNPNKTQEAPATQPTTQTTPTVAPQRSDAYWLAQAKKYGFADLEAVKKFQQENGLIVDGKVGKQTIAAINASKQTPAPTTNSNFLTSKDYYDNASKNYNSYNIRDSIRARGNQYSMTPEGGMHFANTGYTWYDNGRVYDSKNKRKGTYTTDEQGRFDINGIQWDKNGGKLMKYFQAGGAINQQQVAQEKSLEMQLIINELLQGIAHSDPNAIKRFAYRLGIDELTAVQYANKLIEDKKKSANKKKDNDYQLVQEAYNGTQEMAAMAKHGTKLEYVQRLRGKCPEGYEMKMFKVGGKVGCKCQKVEEACKGKKLEDGGESPIVRKFKEGKKCKK